MKDSTAIAIWSVLPLIMAVRQNGSLALLFGSIAAAGLAASLLSRSPATSVALLLLGSAPFAVHVIGRLATGPCGLASADSPAGFVTGTVFDSLLSVPPIVLALGVWRRRGAVVKLPPHA